jgi:hypothetical protein
LDLSKWTSFALAGVVPAAARKIAVNVLSTPGRVPESDRLKVTVSSTSYKAATGLRYTDSGAHASNFGTVPAFALPPGDDPTFWYDFTDQNTLFQDTSRIVPVTASGQEILGVLDKGTAQQPLIVGDTNGPDFFTGGAGGQSYAQFIRSDAVYLDPDGAPTEDWPVNDRTWLIVVRWDNPQVPGNYYAYTDTSNGVEAAFWVNSVTPAASHVNDGLFSGTYNAPPDGQDFGAVGKWTWTGGSNQAQDSRVSYEDNDRDGTNNSLLVQTNVALRLGDDVTPFEGSSWNGRYYEIVGWLNGSNQPTPDELETYVTNKYGVAWA